MGNQVGVDAGGSLLRVACGVEVPVVRPNKTSPLGRSASGSECHRVRQRVVEHMTPARSRPHSLGPVARTSSQGSGAGAPTAASSDDGRPAAARNSSGIAPERGPGEGSGEWPVCENCSCPSGAELSVGLRSIREILGVPENGYSEWEDGGASNLGSTTAADNKMGKTCRSLSENSRGILLSPTARPSNKQTSGRETQECVERMQILVDDSDGKINWPSLSSAPLTFFEKRLWLFMAQAPLTGDPLCFCVAEGTESRRTYCFFIDDDKTEAALRVAIPFLCALGGGAAMDVTGAGAYRLHEILSHQLSQQTVGRRHSESPQSGPRGNMPHFYYFENANTALYDLRGGDRLSRQKDASAGHSGGTVEDTSRPLSDFVEDVGEKIRDAISGPLLDHSPGVTPNAKSVSFDRKCSLESNSATAGHDRTFRGKLVVKIHYHREITCILEALDFLGSLAPKSLFSYAKTDKAVNHMIDESEEYIEVPASEKDAASFYPFLLVNLKVGVSFHKVDGPLVSERVGGSPIGGATFMGLLRLLCPFVKSPLDAFLLAQSGDNSCVDMLVSDIYGGDYPAIGLKGTTIASTFGKQMHRKPAGHHFKQKEGSPNVSESAVAEGRGVDPAGVNSRETEPVSRAYGVSDEKALDSLLSSRDLLGGDEITGDTRKQGEATAAADISRSLLTMMTFNVAQLAYFHSVIHKCDRIVLVGYYLDMPGYLASIQHCFDFWSGGACRTTFVRFAMLLGAIGASLRTKRRASTLTQSPPHHVF